MSSVPTPGVEATPKAAGGLRERKKAKTKAAIQEHAVRLFRTQGFAATTVEQIAEAAEVSPSTVFRYFPTKEELVTTDLVDPVIYAAFEAQPAELSLLEAWRRAIMESLEGLSETEVDTERGRGLLTLSVPELWAAALPNITNGLNVMIELSAKRLGRDPSDEDVRHAVGAMFGMLLVVALDWARSVDPAKAPTRDIIPRMSEGLIRLQAGISL
jgi:AcrR family transcriptional regulator